MPHPTHSLIEAAHALTGFFLLQLMEELDWVKAKSQVVQLAKYLHKTGSPKVKPWVAVVCHS